jgi:tRNA threonylcarbamoyladenosine biosynthesis protein TsaB
MRFAAFETSSDWCSVALWIDGEISAIERRADNRHSELALPMLKELLANTDSRSDTLDAVAFGAGPGSFTGLRIACGIAQGLAFAHGLPVLGVSTLHAIAEESGAARAVACLDARMREVYYAALEKQAGQWREIIGALCVAPDAAPVPPGTEWVGCGNGFAAYPSLLQGRLSSVRSEVHPTAIAIAQLAAPRLSRGEGVDPARAAPVYVRDKVAFTRAELEKK